MAKLSDFARLMRSKNAGPFQLTIDVMMGSEVDYRLVVDSGVITPKLIGDLLRIEAQSVRIHLLRAGICGEDHGPAPRLGRRSIRQRPVWRTAVRAARRSGDPAGNWPV